jgi:enterochelin esterase-like enzyme
VRIDGAAIVLAGTALVAGTAFLLAHRWDRTGRLGRTAAAAACVLAVLTTAALQLNRMTEAYPSWSALRGTKADLPEEPRPPAHAEPAHRVAPAHRSRILRLTVPGPASGLSLPVYVYLPAGYDQDRTARFPVIEALHGYPGSPRTWINRLHIQSHLDAEIGAGRMAPTVVLMPYQTPRQLLDTECTDLAGGPRTETFLTADVPAYARAHFRVRADRAGWGLIGYSAGGYCATNLALRHPGEYAAGASLSGYGEPGITVGDGSEKTTNNDDWRLVHLPPPAVALYLAWAADDAAAKRESLRLAGLAAPPLTVTTAVVTYGGHSDAAWEAMEAPAFDWLSAHLARPR